jgi:hypothetical protein
MVEEQMRQSLLPTETSLVQAVMAGGANPPYPDDVTSLAQQIQVLYPRLSLCVRVRWCVCVCGGVRGTKNITRCPQQAYISKGDAINALPSVQQLVQKLIQYNTTASLPADVSRDTLLVPPAL